MSEEAAFFDDFVLEEREAADVRFRFRVAGEGPPLLLLHGHPRTHTTWWRAAPRLAMRFRVICPDLPGFGRSRFAEGTDPVARSTKRAKADALVALMRSLGHERFLLAGHDRGSYTAFRLAMDHPERVERLALVDCVPILEAFERCDARFALDWWHWFFFAQAEKPERAILADPLGWYGGDPAAMGALNYADFRDAVMDRAVVRTMVEDYRVSPRLDCADDEADRRAGRRLQCPVLISWTTRDDMERLYGDVLAVWRPWVGGEVRGEPLESGHHAAEEAPIALAAMLERFFSQAPTMVGR